MSGERVEPIEHPLTYIVRDRYGSVVVHGEYLERHNAYRRAIRADEDAPVFAPHAVYVRTITEAPINAE